MRGSFLRIRALKAARSESLMPRRLLATRSCWPVGESEGSEVKRFAGKLAINYHRGQDENAISPPFAPPTSSRLPCLDNRLMAGKRAPHPPSRIPDLPYIRSISPMNRNPSPSPLIPSPLASARRLLPQDRGSYQVSPYSRTSIPSGLLPAVPSPQRLPPTPKFSVSQNLRRRFLVRRTSQRPEPSPSPMSQRPALGSQLASALTHVRIQLRTERGNETERNRRVEALVPEPWPIFNAFESFSKS